VRVAPDAVTGASRSVAAPLKPPVVTFTPAFWKPCWICLAASWAVESSFGNSSDTVLALRNWLA
jgi:hypothetical protein